MRLEVGTRPRGSALDRAPKPTPSRTPRVRVPGESTAHTSRRTQPDFFPVRFLQVVTTRETRRGQWG